MGKKISLYAWKKYNVRPVKKELSKGKICTVKFTKYGAWLVTHASWPSRISW